MTRTAIEVMARAICAAAGDDPEAMAYPPMQHRYAIGKPFVLIQPTTEYMQLNPMWMNYHQEARAALEALKDYPPVFSNLGARKGSIEQLYADDRALWADCIDRLLKENADA
jgi:hypothetical protein